MKDIVKRNHLVLFLEYDNSVRERKKQFLLDAELESACVFSRQCVLITMFDSQPVNRDLIEQLKQAVKINIGQAVQA